MLYLYFLAAHRLVLRFVDECAFVDRYRAQKVELNADVLVLLDEDLDMLEDKVENQEGVMLTDLHILFVLGLNLFVQTSLSHRNQRAQLTQIIIVRL